MHTTSVRAHARALIVTVVTALAAATLMTTPAHAVSAPTTTQVDGARAQVDRTAARHRVSRAERIIRYAKAQAGAPYRYGAAGPDAFDCSGFTQFVFRKVGESLPHSSAAQVGRTRRVAHPRRGDLVFFNDGGSVHHVAIYAGNHYVWHAPYSGASVRHERIWTSHVFYGRVR